MSSGSRRNAPRLGRFANQHGSHFCLLAIVELKSSPQSSAPFASYRSVEGQFDEYDCVKGEATNAWNPIAAYLDRLGRDGIQACSAEADRLVHESAANFQVTAEGPEKSRPWKLAIVPLVLEAKQWAELESGLQQRTRLLERVLADLLGEQRLLKERVLPAELMSANPGFSRVYHELPVVGNRLTLTATDLARNNDGSWWVTGDRTRAPSGLGYALENRVITSRVFPHLIRRSNVKRLAEFFASLQDHLNSQATTARDNPRVAILTPGDKSYRYVEDAYLARYLGFTLVQGRDLAVRGNRLNMKTLGRLLPIEVLWRHVSDSKCDPLELDPAESQGVTGLLQVIRGGTVAVANSIGSTIAQMPALMPFLPAAAKFFFGEDLSLPSIATYWCGGAKEREYVLEHMDSLVLRPAFAVTGAPPIEPAELSSEERELWISRIKAAPHQYVAQHRPSRSTTPVWHDGKLRPWHVAMRSFQLQTQDRVDVLPGGLVRVSPDGPALDYSPHTGRRGQDCWIVSESPVDQATTLLPPVNTPMRLVRGGEELPSRVAENLFWLGRHAERSESVARLLRATMIRIAGENAVEDIPDLPRMLAALAAVGQIEPDYAIEELGGSMPMLEEVLPKSVFDPARPQGLQASVINMVDKAKSVRDRISRDGYRIITRIGDDLADSETPIRVDVGSAIDRINRLITDLLAMSGLAHESMTQTHGWRFLNLGRRIERAYQTAELLAATLTHPIPDERLLLESVLRVTDSIMTYRARYLLQLAPVAVLDLLITDDTNPRSLAFQLHSICKLIDPLPSDRSDQSLGADQRCAEKLLHRVRMSDPNELSSIDAEGHRRQLDSLLQMLIEQLPILSNEITARYLIHTSTTQIITERITDTRPRQTNPPANPL